MKTILLSLSLVIGLASISLAKFPEDFDAPVSRIAFGSCNKHDLPQPLWGVIEEAKPDLFIWMGDNVYGDTEDMKVLKAKYDAQRKNQGYAGFSKKTPILSTWDDHDYGENNAGSWYTKKAESQQLALDFTDVPSDDPRRSREGIYGSYTFGPKDKRLKVILIDNRYHSDKRGQGEDMLGQEQMSWLKQELKGSDAKLNLIVSGTQVLPVDHRYEKWANFPATRDALFDFIREEKVPGVMFISGDRHIHEISVKNDADTPYPFVEVTSSGLTHSWRNFPGEPNRHRSGIVHDELGFGFIEINWDGEHPDVTFQIRNEDNAVVNSVRLPLESLKAN
ncbi:alkaline phosphatase D family protein [Rubellicoccus peritrichatus]|uniref:Alkaline phosphatase D family protein n=1 Tax=Rubellicoccus peritrichatus TaxID=3080537 RepID=A0AAQ3LC94_9BACT|nr:alkaline phosphatase D family protein [Puniceicoccus sp. CR14]WOO43010.1 alkaline phosphatase D family protein [Puniceicoccus sp. CR14]